MFVPMLRNFATQGSGILFIVSIIGTLGSLFALIASKESYPLNMQLLASFTFFESLLVGSVCAVYAKSGLSILVLQALIITLAIFAGITTYAFVSKKDFSFMGGALFAALLALIGCSIINLVLGVTGNKSPGLAFLISWGGSVLFSLYILYDSKFFLHHVFMNMSTLSLHSQPMWLLTDNYLNISYSHNNTNSVGHHAPFGSGWCHYRSYQPLFGHPQPLFAYPVYSFQEPRLTLYIHLNLSNQRKKKKTLLFLKCHNYSFPRPLPLLTHTHAHKEKLSVASIAGTFVIQRFDVNSFNDQNDSSNHIHKCPA